MTEQISLLGNSLNHFVPQLLCLYIIFAILPGDWGNVVSKKTIIWWHFINQEDINVL